MRTYFVIVDYIDEAVSSRIHVSLGFPSLTSEGREQIWITQFETFMRYNPDVLVDERAKEYATTTSISEELKLNGREIRNGIYLHINQRAADADCVL